MRPPVFTHLRFVVALHNEDEFLHVLGDGLQPRVVFGGVFLRRRQQLNDRTEGAFVAQNGTAAAFGKGRIAKPARIVAVDDFTDELEFPAEIRDIDRSLNNRIRN